MDRLISDHCDQWNLAPFGPQVASRTSVLQPVRVDGNKGILKVFRPDSDESGTDALIAWYGGKGSVKLLRSDKNAQLLEWIDGPHLSDLVRDGEDALATELLAEVVGKLHLGRVNLPPGLVPLEKLMKPLLARRHSGNDVESAAALLAADLLDSTHRRQPLHGDIHHDNILLHRERGWLAIDPKGLLGDRHYDLANALCNPRQFPEIVRDPARARSLAGILAARLFLDVERLLTFALCYACLSAIWCEQDGDDPRHSHHMANIFLGIRQSS